MLGEDFDLLMIKLANLYIFRTGLNCTGITGSM